MNERSSGSHSVFTLHSTNTDTGQACEGAPNLVDLAGSERRNASGAGKDKEWLHETQNVHKSLSVLGDVIAALGEKSEKSDKYIYSKVGSTWHQCELCTFWDDETCLCSYIHVMLHVTNADRFRLLKKKKTIL
jgi:hypothetical protein